MLNFDLNTPVSSITRVGKTTAGKLKKLGIETVKDLIFYYPFRWQDFSVVSEIAKLEATDAATIKGKIQLINNRRSFAKRKNLTEALIADQSGSIKVIWFNQPYLIKVLQPGDEVYLSGKVDFDRYNLQFVNPVYEKAGGETIHTARLVPIYSLTGNLTQKQIRFLISVVLPAIDLIDDWLPPAISKKLNLPDQKFALRQIHFPQNQKTLAEASRRLKFEELFLFQLRIFLSKQEISATPAEPVKFHEEETKKFVDSLPFKLTNDQRRAAWQIISDLGQSRPMNRLLEGEVGSGKTLVALLAMFNAALDGKQAVLMAPTEILAGQHYNNICRFLGKTKIKTALLTRSQQILNQKKAGKIEVFKKIKSGGVKIIIGTHALIQQDVKFADLGLVVIDEQHRFGVRQRQLLKQKSDSGSDRSRPVATLPHLLSMTATPIPRSLALSLYGDLDISVIYELPEERKKIITKIVEPRNRPAAYDFVRGEIKDGRQTFVICPLIDLSDKLGVKAVTAEYEKLKDQVFPDLKIAMLHGKLKAAAKEEIMADFLAKKYDILVATSVVEVGVDVANASVMLIEGAERFGLSQLHQFRGRVGRSIFQSYCLVFTDSQSEKISRRLGVLVSAKDGFELAEYDLKFRGPGEIYGTSQSGFPEFKIARLTDYQIIAEAKEAAQAVISEGLDKYPVLKQKMDQAGENIHLE